MIRISYAAAALILFAFTAAPAAAGIIGAEVNIDTISPCPGPCGGSNPITEFANDGGENVGSASLFLDNTGTVGHGMGSGSVFFVGNDLVPHLTAVAESQPNARYNAKSTGYRAWDYTGPTITITLDIALTGEATVPSGASVLDAQIRGVVAFIVGPALPHSTDPSTFLSEIVPGTPGIAQCGERFWETLLASDAGPQTVTGSISCEVQSGDRIFAWSNIQSRGIRGGIATSSNSLGMEFEDSTGLIAVPEPGIGLLIAAAVVAARSGRRRD